MTATQQQILISGYGTADQPSIFVFTFDETTGALTPRGSFAGIVNPSFLALHPNGRWLYGVSETGQQQDGRPGEVAALQIERADESDSFVFQKVNQQPSGGDWPCHLLLDPTAQWLIVSNYGTGSVGMLPILSDGSVGELSDLAQHHGGSVNQERQDGPHAHSTAFTPDGRFLISADLGMDQLVIYTLDTAAGKLVPHGHADARPGAGPRHMAFHPNGQLLYVANELDSTVGVYEYDQSNGTLHERQIAETIPPQVTKSQVADIHIAPSAERLYVSNRGHNSLAVFDVGADGGLNNVTFPLCGGDWPRNFALSPSGGFALVANQYSNNVSVLPLLPGVEAAGEPQTQLAVEKPSFVHFVNI